MASLKDYNSRILTLKNMQKVMRAMNMIASIKLRKLFRLQPSLVLFDQSIENIAQDIKQALTHLTHKLIAGSKSAKRSHVVIFTADKGLCGAHNSSAQKALDSFIKNKTAKNISVDVTCVGIRGASYCKRKEYEVFQQTEINDRTFTAGSLEQIASKILKRFLSNEIQEVYLIVNYFRSTLYQETVIDQVIPLSKENEEKKISDAAIEPEPEKFIISAGRLYLYYKLMSALFNSYLSEQSARMTAMENATNNSQDLINHYMTLQNRARQAAITNDLIEIISGKEAL